MSDYVWIHKSSAVGKTTAPVGPLQYGYPLTCPHCEAKFTREHQLAAHLETAHPQDGGR